ncbi:MAG: GNAT family N-acetyltransferase [Spirochaetales bacterium]|nr:GNAT family N-acetyltransferase [Spirochaetales bacterium]
MNGKEITSQIIGIDEIKRIEPLWKELNRLHAGESVYFGGYFRTRTFRDRCEAFYKRKPSELRIEIVSAGGEDVGYCVATASEDGAGEIDSLFLKEPWRGRGIGARLVSSALAWLDACGAVRKRIMVAYGHESVLPFYRKFGFYPRLTLLERKEERGERGE